MPWHIGRIAFVSQAVAAGCSHAVFAAIGAEVDWVVPDGVTLLEAVVEGGGLWAGRVYGFIPVTPGELLTIRVGSDSRVGSAAGGWPNGGDGGVGGAGPGRGGAGSSQVRRGGQLLMVAGGAAGGGQPGGWGGGPSGTSSFVDNSPNGSAGGSVPQNGHGGTQIAAGVGGTGGSPASTAGSGEFGGKGAGNADLVEVGSAGGGGGFFGGGGGGFYKLLGVGGPWFGGGGSSYVDGSVVAVEPTSYLTGLQHEADMFYMRGVFDADIQCPGGDGGGSVGDYPVVADWVLGSGFVSCIPIDAVIDREHGANPEVVDGWVGFRYDCPSLIPVVALTSRGPSSFDVSVTFPFSTLEPNLAYYTAAEIFTAADLVLGGTANPTSVVALGSPSSDYTVYNFQVDGWAVSGSVTVTVPSDVTRGYWMPHAWNLASNTLVVDVVAPDTPPGGFGDFANSFVDAPLFDVDVDGRISGSNVGADDADGAGKPVLSDAYQVSVWAKFTSSVSGQVTLDLLYSDYDTTIGVYTGTLGALIEVIEDDDGNYPANMAGSAYTSKASFAVAAGETYFVAVGGYLGDVGNIALDFSRVPDGPPATVSPGVVAASATMDVVTAKLSASRSAATIHADPDIVMDKPTVVGTEASVLPVAVSARVVMDAVVRVGEKKKFPASVVAAAVVEAGASSLLLLGNRSSAMFGTSNRPGAMSADGMFLYTGSSVSPSLRRYALSSAFDLTTIAASADTTITPVSTTAYVRVSGDGLMLYSLGSGNTVRQHNLGTAWDITGEATVDATLAISGWAGVTGLDFNADGTKLFVSRFAGADIKQYDLSTAWDVNSATYFGQFSTAGVGSGNWNNIAVSPDDAHLLIMDSTNSNVVVLSFGTVGDVTTLAVTGVSPTLGANTRLFRVGERLFVNDGSLLVELGGLDGLRVAFVS